MLARQAASALAPAARASQPARIASGINERLVWPVDVLAVAATSASPSAAPCVASVPCLLGEPQPMMVLQQTKRRTSGSAFAAGSRSTIATGSCPSTSRTTCQPYASKRLRRVIRKPVVHLAGRWRCRCRRRSRVELAELERAGERAGLVATRLPSGSRRRGTPRCGGRSPRGQGGSKGRGQDLLGERHATAVGEALAERAGGVSRWPRCASTSGCRAVCANRTAEVPELLEVERVAREVQQRIEQHRAVLIRHSEPGRGRA